MIMYDIVGNMICWRCIHATATWKTDENDTMKRPYCELLEDIPDPFGSCEEDLGSYKFVDRGYDIRNKRKN